MRQQGIHTLAIGIIVAAASTASAQLIQIQYSYFDLGGGLYGHDFTVVANDGKMLSFFADMDFSGAQGGDIVVLPGTLVNQIKASGAIQVDEEADAILYDGADPLYDMFFDTWIRDEFCPIIFAAVEGPNLYHIECGTAAGVGYASAPLAYVVSDGDVHFSGQVARDMVWYGVSGTSPVPEPASLVLLVLGACLPLLRRRR